MTASPVRRVGRHVRRFRYLRKARMVVTRHPGLAPSSTATAVRYVLLHPELDTFSIRLANRAAVEDVLASAFVMPVSRVAGYVDELLYDDALRQVLPRHLKRKDGVSELLLGRHVPKYVAVRALAPSVTLETGVKDGIGTLVLLRALSRNAAAGREGALLSFDPNPLAGHLVPKDWRHNWTSVALPSSELAHHLKASNVGLLVSDSDPAYDCVATEIRHALHFGDETVAVIGNADWNSAVRDAIDERYEKSLFQCELAPAGQPFAAQRLDLAVFHRRVTAC